MRCVAAALVLAILAGGCLRPGYGRAGNQAVIATGAVLMAAAIGGMIAVNAGDDEPVPPGGDPFHDEANTVFLLAPLAIGSALVITGIRGLQMTPPAGE